MTRFSLFPLAAAMTLAACSGNPLNNLPDDGSSGGSVSTLPGTTSTSAGKAITRYEEDDGTGNGYAKAITYDPVADTFSVDNLAFDGDNEYNRGTLVSSLGPYAVYDAPGTEPDQFTGTPILQDLNRAIYAESASGRTAFAIVRSGSFRSYGFGGFLYQRNGGVTLPTNGQAIYTGDYAALRDFSGRAGLEFATGDMEVVVDFEDFNNGSGVSGAVYNRRIYNVAGTDVTSSFTTALSTKSGTTITSIPTLVFAIGPGVIDSAGEVEGSIDSAYTASGGGSEVLEAGKYYGVFAGPNAKELTGVIVVSGEDPRYEGVISRETGGFILLNGAP